VHLLLRVCLTAELLFISSLLVGSAAAQVSPDHGAVLVPIAPCRILDTSAPTQDAGSSRHVDVRSSRCGRIVPPFATAYAVRVTTVSREAPEKLPPGVGPVTDAVKKVPAPADGRMTFPVSPADIVGVDVVGYYVPAGTPLSPSFTSNDAEGAAALKVSAPSGEAPTNIVYSGDLGNIFLNGAWWPSSGVAMVATAAAPWITARLGNSDGSSSFAVSNTTTADLMRIRSDGVVQLQSNAYFFDGRTDFFGTPGFSSGGVSVPTNVVHDVTLTNPRDAGNSNTSRVVFFNAFTYDEVGSPALTKFAARTGGYYSQENINFDSTFHWHMPNQYHFRAFSSVENKTTFWVKAATGNNSVSQTRADMYVSGRTGLGTTDPAAKLHVEEPNGNVEMIVASADGSGVPHSPTLTLMRKNSTGHPVAKYGFHLDSTDGNKLALLYGTTGGYQTAPLLTVATDGTLTARVVGAVYQDLAEWVPATVNMPAGTVVALNPDKSNEVMPSSREYDVHVAGVVSEQPGLLLGVGGDDKEMVATTGRVKVRVDASRSAIRIGDLLVSSSKPGMAMKSEPLDLGGVPIHRPGTIIGKALESLAAGEGEILVLLSLQ
jgi:hypothetical protein